MRCRAILCTTLMILLPMAAEAQQPAAHVPDGVVEVETATLSWSPLELPGFDPGLELAVIHGDPSSSEAYTIRLRFPAGYSFPAHYHPNAENLTVLSGTFLLGHGTRPSDAALKSYQPGDYIYIPGTMPHFGRVEGETVIQLHGMGPFDVLLADPEAPTQQ
jgi:quercetin dioxygenase-like cupin family protein